MKGTTLSKASKTPSSVVIYGHTMTFSGFGKYPYECGAKDKYPDAAVYVDEVRGSWTFEFV